MLDYWGYMKIHTLRGCKHTAIVTCDHQVSALSPCTEGMSQKHMLWHYLIY